MQTCGQGVSEGEELGGPVGGKAASGHSFHLQGSAGPHADLSLATSVPSAWVLSPKTRQSSEQPPPGSPVSLPPAPCCPQERPLPAGRRTLGVQGRKGVGQLQALIALCLSRPQGLGVGHEGHPLPAPGGPPGAPPTHPRLSYVPIPGCLPRVGRTKQQTGREGPSLHSLALPRAAARAWGQGTAQVLAEARLCR